MLEIRNLVELATQFSYCQAPESIVIPEPGIPIARVAPVKSTDSRILPPLRWCNQLHPSLTRLPFTESEDRAIVRAHVEHGNKWALISKYLPGR